MTKLILRALLVVALVGFLFGVVQRLLALGQFEIDLALLQLIAFPLVLFSLWRFIARTSLLPRWPLLLAAAFACLGALATYRGPADNAQSFSLARLHGDDIEAETRVFREKVNSVLRELGPVRAIRYHGSFATDAEARREFARDPKLRALVWGSARWMNVSFPFEEPVELRFLPGFPYAERVAGLRMVTSVPIVGLSYQPPHDTAFYLGTLLDGVLPSRGWEVFYSGGWDHRDELSLLTAARYHAFWSSSAHQALPRWILGNRYFYRALANGDYDGGMMRCALASYRSARAVLRRGDNADLLAAIYNNAAVAEAVRIVAERPKPSLAWVRRALKKGVQAKRDPNLFRVPLMSWRVASQNLRHLRETKVTKRGDRGAPRKRVAPNPRRHKLGRRSVGS